MHQYASDRGKLGHWGCTSNGCKKAIMVSECRLGGGIKMAFASLSGKPYRGQGEICLKMTEIQIRKEGVKKCSFLVVFYY